MKILIIGSGGREHAIVWALRSTSKIPLEIFCAPGNAGIAQLARLVPFAADDDGKLASFAESEKIDLTFVGPEAPLAAGIVDRFQAAGLTIVGPGSAASRLEASKAFAKEFMTRNRVPTAAYRVADSSTQAIEILRSGEFGSPEHSVVIKADGLAAGKGVIVASSLAEGQSAVEDLMVKKIAGSHAADRVVIEESLVGVEASVLVFCDGRDYVVMPPARDHKRIGEGDTGPNTGGMGSITDASVLDDKTLQRVIREVVEPTIEGALSEGFPFRGVLFLGLMLTDDGPKLLEYNVRFGDPETQAILVRLRTDLLSIFQSIQGRELGRLKVEWSTGSSACVVAANRGYPGTYEKGAIIKGLEGLSDVQVFHAGTTKSPDGSFIATGGRVLGVTSAAENLQSALRLCYRALEQVQWEGITFRRDIGYRAASG